MFPPAEPRAAAAIRLPVCTTQPVWVTQETLLSADPPLREPCGACLQRECCCGVRSLRHESSPVMCRQVYGPRGMRSARLVRPATRILRAARRVKTWLRLPSATRQGQSWPASRIVGCACTWIGIASFVLRKPSLACSIRASAESSTSYRHTNSRCPHQNRRLQVASTAPRAVMCIWQLKRPGHILARVFKTSRQREHSWCRVTSRRPESCQWAS
jgi:hypothetical protein